MVRWPLAAAAWACAACGGPRGASTTAVLAATAVRGGGDVTLYRDRALVRQRVELDVPAAGTARVRIRVAAGLGPDDVVVVDRGGLTIAELRAPGSVPAVVPPDPPAPEIASAEEIIQPGAREPDFVVPEADPPPPEVPVELELVVAAPRPGRVALQLAYVTDRLTWQVAYTMTTGPARDAAVLRGAVAIRNTMGIELRDAKVRLVDLSHGVVRTRTAERLIASFTRRKVESQEVPPARDLGRLDVVRGETRAELVRASAPRRMRSVLVYDPIGAKIDHGLAAPNRDPALGVRPPAGHRVDESFEIRRDPAATAGLPAAPVRLLERRADGSLALVGEARLFEETTRVANTDTISVGTAEDVTGRRDRRELTIDEDHKRVVEEFVVTIENRRPHPVEVVLREHLYRGQNWTLAYLSVPAGPEAKEGPQQVAPRITVAPRSRQRMMYTVVYWW